MSLKPRPPAPFRPGRDEGAQVDRGAEEAARRDAELNAPIAEIGVYSNLGGATTNLASSTLALTLLQNGSTRPFKCERALFYGAGSAATRRVTPAIYTVEVITQGKFTARKLRSLNEQEWDTTIAPRPVEIETPIVVDRRRSLYALAMVVNGITTFASNGRPLIPATFTLATNSLPDELTFGHGDTPLARVNSHAFACALLTKSGRRTLCDS